MNENTDVVGELAAAIADALKEGDLLGHIQAWARVASGAVTPDTRAIIEAVDGPRPLAKYEGWVIRRVQETGMVKSRELSEHFGVTQETARLCLVRMVEDGLLERHGQWRGTWYSGTVRIGVPPARRVAVVG